MSHPMKQLGIQKLEDNVSNESSENSKLPKSRYCVGIGNSDQKTELPISIDILLSQFITLVMTKRPGKHIL